MRLQRYSVERAAVDVHHAAVAMTGAVRLDGRRRSAASTSSVPPATASSPGTSWRPGSRPERPAAARPDLGLGQPRVDARDRQPRRRPLRRLQRRRGAGVARGAHDGPRRAGATSAPPPRCPASYSGAGPDGSGGAFVLGSGGGAGSGAVLWRIADVRADGHLPAAVAVRAVRQERHRGRLLDARRRPARVLVPGPHRQGQGGRLHPGDDGHRRRDRLLPGDAQADGQRDVDGARRRRPGRRGRDQGHAARHAGALAPQGRDAAHRDLQRLGRPDATRARRVLVQKAVGSGWRTVASGRLEQQLALPA